MTVLYPRLLPGATARYFADLQATGPRPPVPGEPPSLSDAVFAATGGTRATAEDLGRVRADIVSKAQQAGFPSERSRAGNDTFDAAVARYLHSSLGLTAGEAAQRQVWAYFGLVLLPDVCAWRFPANDARGFLDDRFVGGDLTRHTLARLWVRAHLLHDPSAADPYELVSALGEGEMDQVLTRRRDVASTPLLVQEIIRAHATDTERVDGYTTRQLLQDSLKRLMRLATFLDLDSLPTDAVRSLVKETRGHSRAALAGAA